MTQNENGEFEVTISSGTVIRTVLILAFFALLWFLRDIALVVVTAVVVASAFEPMVHFFVRKNVPRLLALVAVYVSAIAFLAGLLYFFVPAIIDDVSRLAQVLPKYLDDKDLWNPFAGSSDVLETGLSRGVEGAEIASGFFHGDIFALFKSGIQSGGILQTLSVFFGGFLSFVLIIVLSFYFSAQERGIENFLRLITPHRSRSYVVDLWKRAQGKIGLWFQGQLLLGVLVGVLGYLGLMVMGVESALFLAVIMMVFEIIPVFGPILAAVPAIAIAFTEGIRMVDPGLTAALVVGIFYFIVQQFESHLIYPLVVRKVIGIPPVLVILALIIGAKLAGFLGILLSVPVAAVLMEYFNDLAKERKIYDD